MKRTKVFSITTILFLGITIWYLFIKTYDYQITFRAKGAPGSIYHQILSWESWGNDSKSLNINTLNASLFETVRQQVKLKDTTLNLYWSLQSVNDSVTEIKVGITSKEHSIINRLGVLSGETKFIRSVKKELTGFGKGVNNFSHNFRIKIEGESEIPEVEYLYLSSKTKRFMKAGAMLRANADLYPKIIENKIEQNGYPFVKIREWDIRTDDIWFDFGFPIEYKDSLPTSSKIKYNKRPSRKALKAIFYGNYRNSDQAWFALLEYAKRRSILVEKKPLEIFYNNPMQDDNASSWKAEIFLPIKDK
ncbi:hypothetical protein [Aquimarina sp. MMG016]|uniref:hypothetical protein n=1 Tax=Aquimarina sp. MMG016 TaxID=2822690 RepID=UPI001B39E34E|nr:hypothetical protein [Aquimarina sp. MMG016]MBQ4820820.1 hypothetical protein [Aquimarina sp. MMG016]